MLRGRAGSEVSSATTATGTSNHSTAHDAGLAGGPASLAARVWPPGSAGATMARSNGHRARSPDRRRVGGLTAWAVAQGTAAPTPAPAPAAPRPALARRRRPSQRPPQRWRATMFDVEIEPSARRTGRNACAREPSSRNPFRFGATGRQHAAVAVRASPCHRAPPEQAVGTVGAGSAADAAARRGRRGQSDALPCEQP